MQKLFEDYLSQIQVLHDEIKRCMADLPQTGLDWTPVAEANSIGALVMHVTGAERYLIGDVIARESSDRDRDAEFQTKGWDQAALEKRLDESSAYIRTVLETLTLDDLETERVIPRNGQKYTVIWVLGHILEHDGIHTGHMQLMRQLWDAR
jgi:uncharacterized damage-inducible protein DinB